ncbi:mandelate racemase/muconate lactonizing enzyme family protein [Roseimaritima sediminicola]|uniref:mandelate racemase/muconate lactonizing enzyme family protein n=1 Tax=Roseimaritima sediminicola TaxID=2662066 RepID=UPI00129826D1|nr:mandelate racemase/muconate lactonizing enzyme family protein [Roseimaritima sediminicola]
MLATDLSTASFSLDQETFDYRTPMKFGGRVVTGVTVVTVTAEVETRGGRRGTGLGSMTMGNAWAWPSERLDSQQTLAAVLRLAERIVSDAQSQSLAGHPLDVCTRLAERRETLVREVVAELDLPESIPPLAVLMAASPLEAALFDGHGKALETSSFQLLGPEALPNDLSVYLGDAFKGLHLDRFVRARPQATMPLYHLVGALDPLREQDVVEPIGDGLPEHLGEWINRDGLSHLKIKLAGDDLDWDVRRVVEVSRTADESRRGADAPFAFSLDYNERCDSEDYVLEMLDRVSAESPRALERVQYIEQPTHRDLAAHPENTMHRVAARLPVVIDESLIDLDSLMLAREQGYSGVALKACKGHAEALLMGAAAQHLKMYLCVQDLTCIGISLLHSASLAAHIPTVAAIESNGRQYSPAGNDAYRERFPGMFDVVDGQVPTARLDGPGLGY